ncbi:EAL domain-containing protein [Massilia sp. RP-1-19]|uniref:EAL domain-containing protein n=1 Tax=Massilia polaris TaxID=2728846 RepID=A0A848HIH0_9BURK|nr:EAL domain-containing protein [Massilia polaris]NML61004.1 EAL domain-containing protein [Massilia polaris]
MNSAPFPHNEKERLAALQALDILDTSPEAEFDVLVRIASMTCGVPISLISLVDTERQWFKANIGLPGVSETPRDVAFCAHAILGNDLFEVPDATQDSRFADNPLVAGNPDIRFYAGAPIVLSDGNRVGTLCVIDRQPRQLDDKQREILRCLALAAAASLEGRRAVRLLQQATQNLQVSEDHLRQLYEATPAMLHSIDAQGRMKAVSNTWLSRLGYTRDEVLGHFSSEYLTKESREYAKNVVLPTFFKTGRCEKIEYQMVAKDGAIVDVLLSGILEYDAEGKPYHSLAIIEDVTQRRIIERKLEQKHQRLAQIVDSTNSGTWEWNVQTGQVVFNERWAEIIGESLANLAPLSIQTWIDNTHPEDLKRSGALLDLHFADQNVRYECQVRMRHRDGHWVWVRSRGRVMSWDADGKPEWMFGTHEDITERITEQQALQKARERVSLATDSGHIGIWDWDIAANTLVWDPWMYHLYGVTPRDEVAPYDLWSQHVHPEDLKQAEQALQDGISGVKPFDTEFRIVLDDGSIHHLHGTGRVTRDDAGRPLRMVGANWDVTEARRLTSELAEQHELLQVTLRSIGDAVITTDAEGNVTWLNPVAERMTGWLALEGLGRPLSQVFRIVNEETRKPTENPVLACLEQDKIVGLANHTILISRNGDEFGIEYSAAPIRNAKGVLLGEVLVFHDVTEQRRLSNEMSYRATHDALTGLTNRAEFETRLSRTLQKAHEDRSEHFLLYIDLDQFKLVNDSCGHVIGDQLLQQVSKLLSYSVRDRDTLARLGGDEFAIILEHCTAAPAQRVAQQICERMFDFRFMHDGKRFRIGTSIGLVPVDSRWATTESIMQAADTSCYAAKEAGRNRVHAWFDSDLAMRTRHGEMQWTNRIGKALDEDLFVLFAQRITPLNDAPQGVHAEVLLRMIDSDGTLIPPGAFLPAAERFHLASRIDRWVFKRAVDWMKALPSLDAIENISINLSGQSVGDRAFHRWAIELLNEAGSKLCQKLCIEITETAAVTNLADAALFIEQVHAVGIKVALDDFGAGASSFGYLKSLPVDFLKIDGQFIRDLVSDPLDEASVRCFTDVAKVVGVKTVAEFVENQEVLERLRVIGVDYAQGFLLHRPAPIDEILTATIEVS